jgi:cyclopropane-fatty-acyl-phospholipid synthase
MINNLALDLTESGVVPDGIVRHGIRKLLQQRLDEINIDQVGEQADAQSTFINAMNDSAIALQPEMANEQHYEVPAEFYNAVLGKHGKYSCCYWGDDTRTLEQAEAAALQLTCAHAEIADGMEILELGCGWGSLTLWMAEHYPAARITAVSNSNSQREHIERQLTLRGLENVEIITADMNDFSIDNEFDRVVSVEMFEHMRNYRELFERISAWLKADGKFFMHIFVHRNAPYLFEIKDSTDWMSRYFFSGGMMPSDDLPLFFQEKFTLARRWRWNGQHYRKTSEAWLKNLDEKRNQVWPLLEQTYGRDFAKLWFVRWRIFFLSVAELFAYNSGNEWYVSHYLFNKRDI